MSTASTASRAGAIERGLRPMMSAAESVRDLVEVSPGDAAPAG